MNIKQPCSEPLQPTTLSWNEEGQPLSDQYNDYYFSRLNGLEESFHVFITHNGLPDRWQHERNHNRVFTIAETGFGTGLNFLATWQLWLQTASTGQRLHFISIEKHPLKHEDLRRTLALWPQLADLSSQLIDQYPPPCAGFHRLSFDGGRVVLTLLFGDANDVLEQLHARVDAWYLDGFAPAKNPELWQPTLFTQMARLSHKATTFSTYTAAAMVRSGLQQAGFSVNKVPGFGRKREMIRGGFQGKPVPSTGKAWFQLPNPPPKATTAIVIGAGLAGCATAHALSKRNCRVTLIDQGPSLANAASGNPQGVLYAKLPAQPTLQSRFHLAGYLYTLAQLHMLLEKGDAWDPCGVLQLAHSPVEGKKQQRLIDAGYYPDELVQMLSQRKATMKAGLDLPAGGLFFPDAGWVSPARFCNALVDSPLIKPILEQRIDQIRFIETDKTWQVLDQRGGIVAQSPVLVMANASDAAAFPPLHYLPLKPIRGQVSYLSTTAETAPLKTVLCGKSYVSPPLNGHYCFGASFNLHEQTPEISQQDHRDNLEHLWELLPGLKAHYTELTQSQMQGRVGFRCTTPDYQPLIGAVPNYGSFVESYAQLSVNAKANISTPPAHLPGLYLNIGHGSKGLLSAPLGGELLAAMICNEPLPMESDLIDSLNPARFIIKNLIHRAI